MKSSMNKGNAAEREIIPEQVLGSEQNCFVCGPHNPRGLRLKFKRVGDEVRTTFVPEAGLDGPPGILHGGLQSTLLDEIGAWTIVDVLGRMGFTTSLRVRFLRSARLGEPLSVVGKIIGQTERLVTVKAELSQGKTVASARITYVLTKLNAFEDIIGTCPRQWLRFFPEDRKV